MADQGFELALVCRNPRASTRAPETRSVMFGRAKAAAQGLAPAGQTNTTLFQMQWGGSTIGFYGQGERHSLSEDEQAQ